MDFFSDCYTDIQRKDRFRKLAKCFHPDRGGPSEFMIELQKQWEGGYSSPIDYYTETIRPSQREIREEVQRNMESRIKPLREYIEILEKAAELKNKEIENLQKLLNPKKKSLWERILFAIRGEVPNNYSIK